MASDLLFELGTEELPSGAVPSLAKALADNLAGALDDAKLTYGEVRYFATPRRLAVWIQSVASVQPEQAVTKRGPACHVGLDAEGNSTPALLGFARSCGVSVTELTKLVTDKGEWWAYEAVTQGLQTNELIPELIHKAVEKLPIAKPMSWGEGEYEFVRPVHWAVLLYNDAVIDMTILGVRTGDMSVGHRFHHPEKIKISSAADYESTLHNAYVVADVEKRRNLIIKEVQSLASMHQLTAVMPAPLLDEVTAIVEWPQALMAEFEPEFLDVPAEALVASMQSHQKCFALQNASGQLQPYFITVANIASTVPEQIVSGNEKVMRARLSDADFFYSQDKKRTLADYADATSKVIFQSKLGSLKDKSARVAQLLEFLAQPLGLDSAMARRAALLSKSDLMTGMVGEFPELQGIIGYYYALNDGEDETIAHALNEQYFPRFSGDNLPKSQLGLALSLADRVDTLVGIFAIGQKPTGVKDPFKLRRHALAVIRLLVATDAKLNLSTLLEQSWHGYQPQLSAYKSPVDEVKAFILERLQSYYQSQDITPDIVAAVRRRQDDWLYDMDKRIQATQTFISLPEAVSLAAACKRVNNLLQQHGGEALSEAVQPELLQVSAEQRLFDLIQAMKEKISPLYREGSYSVILTELALMREPIDAFFDEVMVLVEDEKIKHNRLSLLTQLQSLLQGVADIALLSIA